MPFRWATLLKRGPMYALAEGETPEREWTSPTSPEGDQETSQDEFGRGADFTDEKHISKFLNNILKSLMATGWGAREWVQKWHRHPQLPQTAVYSSAK